MTLRADRKHRSPIRPTWGRSLGLGLLAMVLAGCSGGGRSLELSGDEVRRRLPETIGKLIPPEVILCHDEEGQEGAYHLWILRDPGGKWLDFAGFKPKGLERHAMPPSALESILLAKLPSMDRGRSLEPRCWYTHWPLADGAEIQVREILTDQGWFASVERVRF